MDEYQNNTNIVVDDETDISITSNGATLPDAYVGTTDLFGGWEVTDTEPYEGVLVRVENINIDSVQSGGVYWISQNVGKPLADGQVRVDDWFYDISASADDDYTFIQGPLTQHADDSTPHVNYRIQPRSASDVSAI